MIYRARRAGYSALFSTGLTALTLSAPGTAAPGAEVEHPSPRAAAVFSHWTGERRRAAVPRDLVIDPRGLGYLRHSDGHLTPYGHSVAAVLNERTSLGKPVDGDQDGPVVDNMTPAEGATIGSSAAFSATVEDPGSGVKSVSFEIHYPSGLSQSFQPGSNGNLYSITLNGFSDGQWAWQVIAKDNGGKGGNITTTDLVNFTVDVGGGGGGGGGGGDGTVANAPWTAEGPVQLAAGRIYFEMPSNPRRKRWSGYVCSGTVVQDTASDRSTILTAAHCVYDDANKAFARNVMFIPDQDGTSGSGTDLNCSNDTIGCWAPEFGVVDLNWTQAVFPDNIPWDYAYYVVPDSGAHTSGLDGGAAPDALDSAVTPMGLSFTEPTLGVSTHALGYSYSEDPDFMYCAENMTTEGSYNWWLPGCGLSGGSSGGPWTQAEPPLGTGPVMSVNSWGYTNSPGMAGPKLSGSSGACLFDLANSGGIPANTADGDAGMTGC